MVQNIFGIVSCILAAVASYYAISGCRVKVKSKYTYRLKKRYQQYCAVYAAFCVLTLIVANIIYRYFL